MDEKLNHIENYPCLYLPKPISAAWINNYIHMREWDVIIHPHSNFNGGLVKPPLKLGHGWIITYHRKLSMYIFIHVNPSGPYLVITVPTGITLPNGARPSVANCKLTTVKLCMVALQFIWLLVIWIYCFWSDIDEYKDHEWWWRDDMEHLSTLLALCEGNPPVTELWCVLSC